MPDTNEMKELEFAMIDEAFLEASDKHNLSRSAIMLYIFLARNCNFYLKGRVKLLTTEQMQLGARIGRTATYDGLNELKQAGLVHENEQRLFMPLQMEVYRRNKENQRIKREQIDAQHTQKSGRKKDNRPSLTYDQPNTNQMSREEFVEALRAHRQKHNLS